jgi:hypothetical protein
MTVSVVTSCSAVGWKQYGQRFVETFDKFWPPSVALYVASEDSLPVSNGGRQVTFIDLNTNSGFGVFTQRNIQSPRANGLRAGNMPVILDKRHYNFRMDAIKFSKKVFALSMAANLVPAGRLIWLDADVVTIDFVPIEFLLTLPPSGSAIAYLSRRPYHSECGFVGYDLDHPATRPFIQRFVETYATDAVFKLKEWNDCFVFDYLRMTMCMPSYLIPHKSVAHPFVHSALGQYMDHLKGRRKQRGNSHDHPRFSVR